MNRKSGHVRAGLRRRVRADAERRSTRRAFLITAGALFAAPLASFAQQAKKVPRIAYLSASSASSQAPRLEVFRQGLRELGYVEGKNILI